MLTALHLINFKSFADANSELAHSLLSWVPTPAAKVICGTRSDFFTALAADTHWPKSSAASTDRGPSRMGTDAGAAREIIQFNEESFCSSTIFRLEKRSGTYTIEVEEDTHSRAGFRVVREELKIGWRTIFTSHPGSGDPVSAQDDDAHLLLRMEKTGEQRKFGARIAVTRSAGTNSIDGLNRSRRLARNLLTRLFRFLPTCGFLISSRTLCGNQPFLDSLFSATAARIYRQCFKTSAQIRKESPS